MRRYSARKIPEGTHTHRFWLLSKEDQALSVKKLLTSGMSRGAVSDLTGLKLHEIAAIMEVHG
jgi:hypothetical protein